MDVFVLLCFFGLLFTFGWLQRKGEEKKKNHHHLEKGHFDVLGMVLVLKILACATAVMSFSSARVVCMASRRLHDVINTTL